MRTFARSSSLVAAGLLVACTAAHAQVAPVPAPDPTAPVAPAAPPAAAPAPKSVERASRQDIRSMEVLLTQALQTGAQDLARQLKIAQPNSAFVTGTGRARGFVLEGHGVFFDVDVPEMRQSVVWSAQMLDLEEQRQSLQRFLAGTAPDDPRRRFAEERLRQVTRLMSGGPDETINTQMMPRGEISAQTVAPVSDSPMPPAPRALASSPPMQLQQPFRDPNELYTDSVKNALIDVMLKFSGPLRILDQEWLTIAASDSDGPQTSGPIQETSRILISIKGSDLAAFQSGKLTREEVLKRVEVREF